MSKQERIQKSRTVIQKNMRTEVIDGDNRTRSAKEAEALKTELDDLLDEIDLVLEENAETSVAQYVQVNGE